ncbi:MAG: phosphatidate cytidylyltransferase [Vicingus serpentipes]|nr:phosphatidate cytidylyltransferase [Vicingus serpentipes]
MLTRTITGFLFVISIVAAIYYGPYSSALLFLIIILLGVDEFYNLVKKSNHIQPINYWGGITALILMGTLITAAQNNINFKWILIPVSMLFFTFIIELFRKKEHPFLNIAYTLLGILYVVIPFAMLYHLGYYNNPIFSSQFSYQLIIGFFILLWANDTGAYLAGKFLGKHKLFERISPKKTWEGSIGGAILSIALSILIAQYYTNINITEWVIVSIIIVVFGGIGDLVESMLKRSLGIKDSGKLLPGHGGILDRFDGLLIAAPFVYCYLQLIQ